MSIENHGKTSELTSTKDRTKVKRPDMYKVIIHNDDYTPMDFVVDILVGVFRKNSAEATQLMLRIHNNGHAIGGVYTYEVAETKVHQVHSLSEQREYPLRATLEEE